MKNRNEHRLVVTNKPSATQTCLGCFVFIVLFAVLSVGIFGAIMYFRSVISDRVQQTVDSIKEKEKMRAEDIETKRKAIEAKSTQKD